MSKDVAEAIVRMIREYAMAPADTNDINGMLDLARRIATYKVGLAVRVAGLYRDKVGTEFRRKVEYDRQRFAAVRDGKSAAAADVEARASIAELMEQEANADAEHQAGKLLLDNAGDVLETLRQQIAQMRTEKRETSFTN
jgi:hypothetical protein